MTSMIFTVFSSLIIDVMMLFSVRGGRKSKQTYWSSRHGSYNFDTVHDDVSYCWWLCLLQSIGSWPYSYVYSAYIDDRPAPDLSQLHHDVTHRHQSQAQGQGQGHAGAVLRVFAWVPRHMPAGCSWLCLFWRKDHELPLERPVIAWTDLDHYDKHRKYVSMRVG